jgi:predicted SAM-dependent methyltransferase
MKYLNLGCGMHYSLAKEWTNIDFVSTGAGVLAYNLLSGLPYEDDSFDLVYHSHVLEHFSKNDGEKFIKECMRVLKPGGVLRIAIPDLEQIVRNYIAFLDKGIRNPNDKLNRFNYEWMLLEMYDQTVRNVSSGNMGKYLFQKELNNEEFVMHRIGEEGRAMRQYYLKTNDNIDKYTIRNENISLINGIKNNIIKLIFKIFKLDMNAYMIGEFRLSGEIHQWMYDQYSIHHLLSEVGMNNIIKRDAFESYVQNWREYGLDGKNGVVRKPDSLFMEALK